VHTELQYCSALKSFPMQQIFIFVLNHVVKFIGATQDLLFPSDPLLCVLFLWASGML